MIITTLLLAFIYTTTKPACATATPTNFTTNNLNSGTRSKRPSVEDHIWCFDQRGVKRTHTARALWGPWALLRIKFKCVKIQMPVLLRRSPWRLSSQSAIDTYRCLNRITWTHGAAERPERPRRIPFSREATRSRNVALLLVPSGIDIGYGSRGPFVVFVFEPAVEHPLWIGLSRSRRIVSGEFGKDHR
jgi:hypothetical protein